MDALPTRKGFAEGSSILPEIQDADWSRSVPPKGEPSRNHEKISLVPSIPVVVAAAFGARGWVRELRPTNGGH